jgi:hypothetical protein
MPGIIGIIVRPEPVLLAVAGIIIVRAYQQHLQLQIKHKTIQEKQAAAVLANPVINTVEHMVLFLLLVPIRIAYIPATTGLSEALICPIAQP